MGTAVLNDSTHVLPTMWWTVAYFVPEKLIEVGDEVGALDAVEVVTDTVLDTSVFKSEEEALRVLCELVWMLVEVCVAVWVVE
jgi:hypothetical protein